MYIRFDPMTSNANVEGPYSVRLTVTSTSSGVTKSWKIYPGSPDNNIIQYASNCGNPEGYYLRLQRPPNENFRVSIEMWLTCGGCGAGNNSAIYFSNTETISSSSGSIPYELWSPQYQGISTCFVR